MLSSAEYQRHRKAMRLKTLLRPKAQRQEVSVTAGEVQGGSYTAVDTTLSVPAHRGLHVLLSDCGNLEPGNELGRDNLRCGIYDERPTACRSFEVGSPACISTRAKFGLDGHEASQPLHREKPIKMVGWVQVE